MAVRKKRTALDQEISRLQKNTRNKLYRLRKRGADTQDIDPRKNTEFMNGSQKRRYANQLREFNARDNSFVVQNNGVALPKETYIRFAEGVAAQNVRREEVRKQLSKLENIATNELTIEAISNVYADFDPYTGKFKRRRGQLANEIVPIERDEPFKSVEQLERALEGIRRLNRSSTEEKRRRQLRTNLETMAQKAGRNDIVRNIKGLNVAQVEYLTYRTLFIETLYMAYTARDENEEYSKDDLEQKNYEAFITNVEDYIEEVRRIRPNYTVRKKAPKPRTRPKKR